MTDKNMTRIDAILKGAIDPHVHSGPSIAARGSCSATCTGQSTTPTPVRIVSSERTLASTMISTAARKAKNASRERAETP